MKNLLHTIALTHFDREFKKKTSLLSQVKSLFGMESKKEKNNESALIANKLKKQLKELESGA